MLIAHAGKQPRIDRSAGLHATQPYVAMWLSARARALCMARAWSAKGEVRSALGEIAS
jgi:hypothetical protein